MSSYTLSSAPRLAGLVSEIVRREMHWDHTCSVLSEVDLSQVERLRARAVVDGKPKPSYTAFVIKALALALRAYPCANRRLIRRWWRPFSGLCYQQFHECDVAVGIERHVPDAECVAFTDIVRGADRLSLDEVSERLRALADCDETNNRQWREFQWLGANLPTWLASRLVALPLRLPGFWVKYRGGAAMVSSAAKYGADAVLGTWHCPVGISFGQVKKRPIVRADRIVAAPTFMLLLNFDRRLLAGGPAARFFQRIVEILEQAEE